MRRYAGLELEKQEAKKKLSLKEDRIEKLEQVFQGRINELVGENTRLREHANAAKRERQDIEAELGRERKASERLRQDFQDQLAQLSAGAIGHDHSHRGRAGSEGLHGHSGGGRRIVKPQSNSIRGHGGRRRKSGEMKDSSVTPPRKAIGGGGGGRGAGAGSGDGDGGGGVLQAAADGEGGGAEPVEGQAQGKRNSFFGRMFTGKS